ncbi:MAG: hypothetical protein NZ740_06945 [Kiritimatiellae bacterium]|nr:hypothetical protein [Kiritimatiellia bacterium]MDW8458834.1 hypothetical protein [Verrucomicrobiota bacterium]
MPTRIARVLKGAGRWLAVVGLAGAAGCGWSETTDESTPLDGPSRDFTQGLLPAAATEEELVRLVLQQPAPDGGEGTVSNWIDRLSRSPSGQPLFPRWHTRRRAATRFEVRYTYKWVGLDSQIVNRGYMWMVDTALNTVSAPQPIADADAPKIRSPAEQQQRRAEDPEYSLR